MNTKPLKTEEQFATELEDLKHSLDNELKHEWDYSMDAAYHLGYEAGLAYAIRLREKK